MYLETLLENERSLQETFVITYKEMVIGHHCSSYYCCKADHPQMAGMRGLSWRT